MARARASKMIAYALPARVADLLCPLAGGLLWTLLSDELKLEEVSYEKVAEGVPHFVRCGGSVLNKLHLGPPMLTVLLMLPVKRVVRGGEKSLKHLVLLLHRLCDTSRRGSGRGADLSMVDDDEDDDAAAKSRVLQQKRSIETSIRRHSIGAPLLTRASAGRHARLSTMLQEEQEEEEASAVTFARELGGWSPMRQAGSRVT